MINSTLTKYKESFKTNLLAFLNEYEDNTKTFFLQQEKEKYRSYQNSLTKIKTEVGKYSKEELQSNPIHKSVAADLKSIDENIYDSIITELYKEVERKEFSLSLIKNDKISIETVELENLINSSILILKFISNQIDNPEKISKSTYIDEDGEVGLKQQVTNQLDVNLKNWLDDYEETHKYLPIPMLIEEKADYVTDTYKNYEERYFQYQIDVCNTILREVSYDKTIINLKKRFENNIYELRSQFPLPKINIETIISDINNAFFRLEKFMEGSVSVYQTFLFNDAFTLFFNELNKVENVNERNFKLRDNYHNLLSHIDYAFDKSEFKNQNAYENEDFNRDCNEICYIHFYRMVEFGIDTDLENTPFVMPSILDIVKAANSSVNSNISQNFNTSVEALSESLVYNENLVNDPLLNPENEYIILEKNLKNDEITKVKGVTDYGVFQSYEYEEGFEDWQKNQNLKIGESFKQLVKKLNREKTFFFGCSFVNYKHNYEKRLAAFLDEFYDTEEIDFIKSEEEFLENILYDLKNPEGAHDGYAVSGYDNFSKAYKIVINLGYDQYIFSDNKKTAFLEERKAKLFPNEIPLTKTGLDIERISVDKTQDVEEDTNNFLESTIHEYLEEFKIEINGNGYDILVKALFEYFSNGIYPVLNTKINFKRINKKRVGWALKELYKSERTSNLEIEYFRFAKDNINLFANEIIVEKDFKKSKFYKAFTTNPAK